MVETGRGMMTLKEARDLRGWRREDLASKAHVGLSTIIRIETGETAPRYPIRLAITTALGLSVDDIAWTKDQQGQAHQ